MNKKQFIRNLYINFITNSYKKDAYFENEYLSNEYDENSKDHEHNFWYCVDVCWRSLNEFDYMVCLFQMVSFHLILNEIEQKKIQNEFLNYGQTNVKNWDEQMKQHFNQAKVNDKNFWWANFG